MKVSGQFHAPADLPSGKDHPIPTEGKVVGPHNLSGGFGELETPCFCQKSSHKSEVQLVDQSLYPNS